MTSHNFRTARRVLLPLVACAAALTVAPVASVHADPPPLRTDLDTGISATCPSEGVIHYKLDLLTSEGPLDVKVSWQIIDMDTSATSVVETTTITVDPGDGFDSDVYVADANTPTRYYIYDTYDRWMESGVFMIDGGVCGRTAETEAEATFSVTCFDGIAWARGDIENTGDLWAGVVLTAEYNGGADSLNATVQNVKPGEIRERFVGPLEPGVAYHVYGKYMHNSTPKTTSAADITVTADECAEEETEDDPDGGAGSGAGLPETGFGSDAMAIAAGLLLAVGFVLVKLAADRRRALADELS